jgi:hypothetical protein
VRDGIVADLKKQAGTEAALKAAEAATAKLEAGASFDDVAKQLGVTAEPAKFIGRGEPSVPAQILSAAFTAPKPVPASGKAVYRAIKLTTGGAAVFAVSNLTTKPADSSKPADLAFSREAAARIGEQEVNAYIDEVRRTSDVKKNLRAFD